MQVTVLRMGGSVGTAEVGYRTLGSTAVSPSDFGAASGVLTFEDGVTEKTISVTINPDLENEGNETFTVQLNGPLPSYFGNVGDPREHEVTIEDKPVPQAIVRFETETSTVAENAGTAVITVIRSGATDRVAVVSYATANASATAGSDYTSSSGSLEFGPGVTERTITVPINDDLAFEGHESFTVTLSNPGTGVQLGSPGAHTVTIQNDDEEPIIVRFAAATSQVSEGGPASITVVREGGAAGTVSVSFAMPGSTATAGEDYVATSGTLTFGPGVTAQTISVSIIDDSMMETTETIRITLSNPTGGASLGWPNAHFIDVSDNDAPVVAFEGSESSIVESATQAFIKVTRTKDLGQVVSVSYQISPGTATADVDFISTGGTLDFPASVAERTIVVPILPDNLAEGAETFTLRLSNPAGGAVLGSKTEHVVTIRDASIVAFEVVESSVTEADSRATIKVARTGNLSQAVSVMYQTSAGSASAGVDFDHANGTLDFPASVTERTIVVPIVADDLAEGDETFTVTLSNPTGGGVLGSKTAHEVTIHDDALPEVRKGTYRGLLIAPNAVSLGYGAIAIKTTETGEFTGSLQVHGKALRLKGRFSEAGRFSQEFTQVPVWTLEGSTLELQLGEGGGVLAGTFQTLGGVSFQVEAKLDAVGTRASPVAEANAYTALLQTELASNPAGFLRARVKNTGEITFSGRLPDGKRVSGSTHLAEDRSFPIFVSSYERKLGCLAGTARFDLADPLPLTGGLHWQKPPNSRPPYPGGLMNEPVELVGNVYTPPRRQRALDDFDSTQGSALFQTTTAASPSPVVLNALWNQNNTIRILSPESTRRPLRVSLQPKTGLFTGTFRDAENQPRRFFGICIQRSEPGEDVAAGLFVDGEGLGRVELVPQH